MKKLMKLLFVLLITLSVAGATYAASSCNINLKTENTQINKGQEVVVYANIENLQTDRGIISFVGTLEYDKESLNLEKIEGQNYWETPVTNYGYNPSNGKIVITGSAPTKTNQAMLKFTFTVKQESKANLVVTLKDMSVADGEAPVKVTVSNLNLTVKEGTDNENPNPGTDTPDQNPGDNNGGSNNSGNNNGGNNSNTSTNELKITSNVAQDKKLPQTGNYDYMILIGLSGLILISAGAFIKVQVMNKNK